MRRRDVHIDELEPRVRSARAAWLVLLIGPAVWYAHFWVVYLLAEAMCASGGTGTRIAGLAPVAVLTVVITVLAAGINAGAAIWALRRWRSGRPAVDTFTDPLPDRAPREMFPGLSDGDLGPGRQLTFAGFLLSSLFALAVVFVGTPALVLTPC